MYSAASPTQYGYQGAAAASSGALIFEAVPTSNPLHGVCAFPAARARGTWHVAIAYLVKATIMARDLHLGLPPATINEPGPRERAIWLSITVALLVGAWLVSSAIPSLFCPRSWTSRARSLSRLLV